MPDDLPVVHYINRTVAHHLMGQGRAIAVDALRLHRVHAPQRSSERVREAYSHSMVPGGFEVMSTVTRLISRTSLVIRVDIRSSTS